MQAPVRRLTKSLTEVDLDVWYDRLNIIHKIKKACQFCTCNFWFWLTVAFFAISEPFICAFYPSGIVWKIQLFVLCASSFLYVIQLIGVATKEWERITKLQMAIGQGKLNLKDMPIAKLCIFLASEGEYTLEGACLIGGWVLIFWYPGIAILRCFRVYRLLWFYEVKIFKDSTEYYMNPLVGQKFMSRLFNVLKFAVKAITALGNEMFRLADGTRGGLILMIIFFYSAYVLGAALWVETNAASVHCSSIGACTYTLMRLTFYDGNGFDFAYFLAGNHIGLFFITTMYMCITAFGILNGLVGIFGSSFAHAAQLVFDEDDEDDNDIFDDRYNNNISGRTKNNDNNDHEESSSSPQQQVQQNDYNGKYKIYNIARLHQDDNQEDDDNEEEKGKDGKREEDEELFSAAAVGAGVGRKTGATGGNNNNTNSNNCSSGNSSKQLLQEEEDFDTESVRTFHEDTEILGALPSSSGKFAKYRNDNTHTLPPPDSISSSSGEGKYSPGAQLNHSAAAAGGGYGPPSNSNNSVSSSIMTMNTAAHVAAAQLPSSSMQSRKATYQDLHNLMNQSKRYTNKKKVIPYSSTFLSPAASVINSNNNDQRLPDLNVIESVNSTNMKSISSAVSAFNAFNHTPKGKENVMTNKQQQQQQQQSKSRFQAAGNMFLMAKQVKNLKTRHQCEEALNSRSGNFSPVVNANNSSGISNYNNHIICDHSELSDSISQLQQDVTALLRMQLETHQLLSLLMASSSITATAGAGTATTEHLSRKVNTDEMSTNTDNIHNKSSQSSSSSSQLANNVSAFTAQVNRIAKKLNHNTESDFTEEDDDTSHLTNKNSSNNAEVEGAKTKDFHAITTTPNNKNSSTTIYSTTIEQQTSQKSKKGCNIEIDDAHQLTNNSSSTGGAAALYPSVQPSPNMVMKAGQCALILQTHNMHYNNGTGIVDSIDRIQSKNNNQSDPDSEDNNNNNNSPKSDYAQGKSPAVRIIVQPSSRSHKNIIKDNRSIPTMTTKSTTSANEVGCLTSSGRADDAISRWLVSGGDTKKQPFIEDEIEVIGNYHSNILSHHSNFAKYNSNIKVAAADDDDGISLLSMSDSPCNNNVDNKLGRDNTAFASAHINAAVAAALNNTTTTTNKNRNIYTITDPLSSSVVSLSNKEGQYHNPPKQNHSMNSKTPISSDDLYSSAASNRTHSGNNNDRAFSFNADFDNTFSEVGEQVVWNENNLDAIYP